MVGGDAAAFATVRPILEAMGNPDRIVRIGDSGAGQLCKVCNQMVIGGTLAAVSEAFALARKAGVEPALVRDALLGGFAASRVLEVHGERILHANYKPGFRAALYAKDLRIATATRAEHAMPGPVSDAVHAAHRSAGRLGTRRGRLLGAGDGRVRAGRSDVIRATCDVLRATSDVRRATCDGSRGEFRTIIRACRARDFASGPSLPCSSWRRRFPSGSSRHV